MAEHGQVCVPEDRSGGEQDRPQAPDPGAGQADGDGRDQRQAVQAKEHLSLQLDERDQDQVGDSRREQEGSGHPGVPRRQPAVVRHRGHEEADRATGHEAGEAEQVVGDQDHVHVRHLLPGS